MGYIWATPRLDGLLARLEQAGTPTDLTGIVSDMRDVYRIDHMVYHWVVSEGRQYGWGTYDVAWVRRYADRRYLRIDPVVQGCYQRFHPVDWKRLDWSGKAARAFLKDAHDHGVGKQGYSIPIRGPNGQFALFSVNHTCDDQNWARFRETHRQDLILLAHFFHQKALDLRPGRKTDPVQPLSPREVEAMTMLAIGYNRAQAADMLSISEHTLRVYVESARFKLGAVNTTHAVARALSLGLIVI